MVMRYWENQRPGPLMANPSPQEVYEALYRPEQKGIRLADMKRYLEERGFRVFTLRGEWADVEEHLAKGRPIVAGLRAGRSKPVHFVVVTGADFGFVWLNEQWFGELRLCRWPRESKMATERTETPPTNTPHPNPAGAGKPMPPR